MIRPCVVAAFFTLCALTAGSLPFFKIDFRDVASEAKLSIVNVYGSTSRKDYILETTGSGAAIFDYDGDGKNDIYVANGTRLHPKDAADTGKPALYRNLGNGRFEDMAQRAGLGPLGWAQGACVGDYNNDGHPDLLVTVYGHNTLYRNKGNASFEDVTEKSHLPVSGTRYGSGCAFLDYDRDGYLDLFVANYVDLDLATTPPHPGSDPRGLPLAHNVLYHNNRDGTFTDVSESSGILKPGGRYGLGVAAADFDNDGWPDIYVACDMTPSLLYHNEHNGTFQERGAEAGVAYNFDGALQSGMGVAVGDYDGDGLLDIAKTNFSGDLTSLYHNDDGKFFTDVSLDSGLRTRQLLGWGVAFVDVDDDGWRDLMIANGHLYPDVAGTHPGETYLQPTILYRNLGTGKFLDVTEQSGPGLQTPRPARGLAYGDLDGDGRPEFVIVNMNAAPSLLKNDGPHGHYLNVQLTGTKSNRSAIGARVNIRAGARTMMDEVIGGGSYYSQSSLTLHFGIGAAARVDAIEIRWPSGVVQKLGPTDADRLLAVTEP
jgi:hypothetical protein